MLGSMKIAQVCHRFYPYIGGVQVHVKEISERLVKKGFQLEVLTTDPSKKLPREEMINDVIVKRFRSFAPSEAYYFSRELKNYLKRNSNVYDLVHTHNYHAFPAIYAANAKKGNRLIFTPHYHGGGRNALTNLLHAPYRRVGRNIFRKSDRIICVSNHERRLILNDFSVDEKKIVVIPNGVDEKEFKGLKKEKKSYRTILYVGRLEKYKGVQHLIKAMVKLDKNIILKIVGRGSFKKNLVKLAKRLGLVRRVKFRQDLSRRELLQSYLDADLFVLVSKYEAYGISVAEALVSGTPCVIANTSALQEWIDGKNCFGIDYPIDVDELARLIRKVMGKEVRNVEFMSWDKVVNNLIAVYQDVFISGSREE